MKIIQRQPVPPSAIPFIVIEPGITVLGSPGLRHTFQGFVDGTRVIAVGGLIMGYLMKDPWFRPQWVRQGDSVTVTLEGLTIS